MKAKEDNVILLSKDEAITMCKLGEGANTCIWLLCGQEGLVCHYYSRPTGLVLRWEQNLTVAKRDGCPEVRALELTIDYVDASTLEDILRHNDNNKTVPSEGSTI